MATELAKAYVQIVPSARGIKGSIEKELGGEAQSAGESAGASIASGIKKAIAAAGIGKLVKDSLLEGAALQQSIGGVETLFKDAAGVVKKNADIAFSTAGVSANEYMESVTSFAASLLQGVAGDTDRAAKIADMAMIDMSDNANKMGSDMQAIQYAYQGFAKQNYTMLDNLKLGYGGSKTEMQRLLADAQKLSGVEYNIENLADVYEAIHVIQGELDITGTTAKEAEETFSGSFASMRAAAKNLLGNLTLGEDIRPSLQALGKTISTFVKGNLIPMLGNLIRGIPTLLRGALSAAMDAMMDIIQSLPQMVQGGTEAMKSFAQGLVRGIPESVRNMAQLRGALLKSILEWLPDILHAGMDMIEGLAQGIISAAPIAVDALAADIRDIVSWLSQHTGEFLNRGIEIIKAVADGILQNAPGMINALGGVLAEVAGWIVESLPSFLERGAELIAYLAQGIGNALPNILDAIGGVIRSLLEKLTDGETLKNIFNAGVNLLKELVKGILSLVGKAGSYLWNNAGTIVTTIIKAVTSLLKNIFNLGVDLLKKLWEGIKSWFSTLFENAKEIPRKIISGIKELFTNIFNLGVDLLKKLWEGIKSWFWTLFENAKEIPRWIANGIMAVGELLLGAAGWIVDTLISAIKGLADLIIGIGRTIAGWISEGIKSIKSFAEDTSSSIAAAVKAAAQNERVKSAATQSGQQIGKALSDSAKSATESGMKGVVQAVRDALNKIKNMPEANAAGRQVGANMAGGTKQTLVINSPSKVYEEEIGHWLPPGIALGVKRNMKPFLDSMEGMAELGIDAFNSEINPNFTPATPNNAAETILALLARYLPEIADGKDFDAAELYAAFNRQMGMAMS